MPTSSKRAATLLWRALRLRCPNCGGGPILGSWLKIRERCPICGIRLERGEEGYQVGAYMFNIVAAELERAVEEARLRVPIGGAFRLQQAAEAHARVKRGHVLGRIVLRPSEEIQAGAGPPAIDRRPAA